MKTASRQANEGMETNRCPAPDQHRSSDSSFAGKIAADLNLKTWEDFKSRGNDHFGRKNFKSAVADYTKVMELKMTTAQDSSSDAVLHSNRAAAYLELQMPVEALADCISALAAEPDHVKATFRQAKAQVALRNYREAKQVLSNHASAAAEPSFQKEMVRVERFIRESEQGEYDLLAMVKETIGDEAPRLDHADFAGGVRVEWISDAKGYGLMAPRDYAPGDLVFACKAFEAAYNRETTNSVEAFYVARIFERVSNDRRHLKELYRLYAGTEFVRLDMRSSLQDLAEHQHLPAVDARHIAAAFRLNAFGQGRTGDPEPEAEVGANETGVANFGYHFKGGGLWILPSFMNHSCVPNVTRFFVGDFMFVRAARQISKGDELTVTYVPTAWNLGKRKSHLKNYGFTCNCELCQYDEATQVAQPNLEFERGKFSDLFNANYLVPSPIGKNPIDIDRASAEVAEFASRFEYKDRFDPLLSRLYYDVARAYRRHEDWAKAAAVHEKGYAVVTKGVNAGGKIVASPLLEDAFLDSLHATVNFIRAEQPAKAESYFRKLCQAAVVLCGSDNPQLLALLYPGLLIEQIFETMS